MAAVTEDRMAMEIWGSTRAWVGQVDIAANNDTFATGFSQVLGVSATPEAVADGVIGVDVASTPGTVIFKTAGAAANVQLIVLGK